VYPGMSDEMIDKMVEVIKTFYKKMVKKMKTEQLNDNISPLPVRIVNSDYCLRSYSSRKAA